MSDTIYRQNAIDAVMDEFKLNPTNAIRAKNRIEALPSAQPEVIRCKDCKHWAKTWTNDNWSPDSHYCSFIDGRRNGDWYCADAEREEE